MRERYLRGLTAAVGQAAAAYGFTLVTWCSGAMVMHFHGMPSPFEVALFIVGAVGAFVLVELGATRGTPTRARAAPTRAVWLAGAMNGVSAGVALACAYGLSAMIESGLVAWPLTSLVGSAVYFMLVGLQVALSEGRTSS